MKSLSTPSAAELQTSRNDKQKSIQRGQQNSFKTTLAFWGFVGPLILGLIVFFYIPILWSLILSFSNARSVLVPTGFVGLDNYRAMLSDAGFIKALATFTIF